MTEDPITVAAHEIRDLIDQINGTWLKGRSADLDPFFHEDVVVQPPGDSPRAHGKASCIASYEAFTRQAHVRQFTPGEAEIDVFGDTAVATYRYRMLYELEGQAYDETGGELLVLLKSAGDWRVAWRTMLT
jgi:ketosteroid isomerase-like protein